MVALWAIVGLLPAMRALENLSNTIINSLRLLNGPNLYMSLSRADAPGLYEMADEVAAKIGVESPDEISLEMSTGASVRLQGYRTGCGRTKLFIGYDVLTVLTESQLESIIAHELAHSKLIHRAHSMWCDKGLWRAIQLNENLANLVAIHQHKKKKFYTAQVIHSWSAKLLRLTYRLYAKFRQQQELAADHLAAQMCGSNVYKDALMKLWIAAEKSRSIEWRERKICAQCSESFVEWLRDKLTPANDEERIMIESRVLRSDYDAACSTHPSLNDRISLLPSFEKEAASNKPAIELLAHPDNAAANYVHYLDAVLADEERKNSYEVKAEAEKKAKKAFSRPVYTLGQNLGMAAIVLGIFCLLSGIVMFFCEPISAPGLTAAGSVLLGTGTLMYIKCAKREACPLPVPTYQLWREGLTSYLRKVPAEKWKDDVKRHVLLLRPKNMRGRGPLSAFWADVCYRMLAQCDYRGALVASELCLAEDKNRLEGLLANAISLAWLNNVEDSYAAINKAYTTNRFGKSMSWGVAWMTMLNSNWNDAEIYLHKAADLYSDDATVLAALSMCQRQRGKIHEATASIRKAVSLSPKSVELRKSYVNTLLIAGQPKEALEELGGLGSVSCGDKNVMFQMVSAHSLCGHMDKANALALILEEKYPEGKTHLWLARIFSDAGNTELSLCYHKNALKYGFYPEALYAIAHAENKNNCRNKARELLISAIDCTKTAGEGSVGALGMLQAVCFAILTMSDESEECRFYQVKIDLTSSPADANTMQLRVCAHSAEDAMMYVRSLYSAMHPGIEMPEAAVIECKEIIDDMLLKKTGVPGIHEVCL